MTAPMQVLLVEDDPADVLLITDALHQHNPAVVLTVAGDGVAALEHLQDPTAGAARRPDLIVVDLNVPRMDGRELLAVLKNDEDFKHIPVVVLTTSATPADVTGAYRAHANAYVTKPIDLAEFDEVVAGIEHFFAEVAKRPGGPA
jgi:CheY-like chemotaxis protein